MVHRTNRLTIYDGFPARGFGSTLLTNYLVVIFLRSYELESYY